jgi:hypothetical protein
LDIFLSHYNNKVVENSTKMIFVHKNKTLEFNNISGIRQYSKDKLTQEIKVYGQYFISYISIPKYPYIDCLFLIYLRSFSLLKISDELTQPESLVKMMFCDVIYYEKSKLFFGVGSDEETIYSFRHGDTSQLSLFLNKINDQPLIGKLLDVENYDSRVFLFYYTTHRNENFYQNRGIIYAINSDMKVEFELTGHRTTLKNVFYSDKYPEKDVIFSIDSGFEIRVWKLKSKECVRKFKLPFRIKEVYEIFKIRSDALFIYGIECSGIILLKEKKFSKAFKCFKLPDSSIEKKNIIVSCRNLEQTNSFKIYEIDTSDEIKVNESLYEIN